MARTPSRASKTSLYRISLEPEAPFLTAAKSEYTDREEFFIENVTVGSRSALLVYGQIPNASPDWLDHAQSLTSFRPPCINNTSASLLLLRLDDEADHAYGLTWGMGHLLISSNVMDDGFGLRFALRRADAEQVSALTTHALDTLPRTARLSVFGGTTINSFGMEEIGEVVSRLVGKIPADGFSSDKPGTPTFITVKGADALSVPLGKTAKDALSDLHLIDSVIRNEVPAEGLEHLENTRPLRPGNPKIELLEKRFNEVVADLKPGRLALSWPAEWNEDAGEPAKYRITGTTTGTVETPDLQLEALRTPLAENPDPAKLERLRKIHIQGLNEDGGVMSRKISGDKWISFECDLDDERFVMQRGRWYNVGGAYIEMLDRRVDRILEREATVALPPWPMEWKKKRDSNKYKLGRAKEFSYNNWAADSNPDLLLHGSPDDPDRATSQRFRGLRSPSPRWHTNSRKAPR
ncbi:DUF6119 family protein [Pseudonocardia sp. HH130630-07]|uniref:DUF6119 family protein n=1 Tax=Pseudonocardia sp. HH130630-07 TaxID=1690815 RepID=UPI0018D2DFC0|nr:DUF6119 family protein [Pseudonocardia sp. HH130630-07]